MEMQLKRFFFLLYCFPFSHVQRFFCYHYVRLPFFISIHLLYCCALGYTLSHEVDERQKKAKINITMITFFFCLLQMRKRKDFNSFMKMALILFHRTADFTFFSLQKYPLVCACLKWKMKVQRYNYVGDFFYSLG